MDTNLERAPILVADPGRRRHSLVGRHFRPLELVLCMGYVKIVMIFFVFFYSSFDQASEVEIVWNRAVSACESEGI